MNLSSIDFTRAFKTTLLKCIAGITVIGVLSVPTSFWPSDSVNFLRTSWPQALLMVVCVVAGFIDIRTARVGIIAFTVSAILGAMQLNLGGGLSGDGRHFIGGASQTYDPNSRPRSS